MNIGTKSLLFGYHQVLIHPLFVALAWWRLYGFPWDPRLWLAFVVHDWGYWGKPNMDGSEGETHPRLGAAIMHYACDFAHNSDGDHYWHDLTLYHSRFLAWRDGREPSLLCTADKFSIVITPTWLQLLLVNLTGEIREYMSNLPGRTPGAGKTQRKWIEAVKTHLRGWVAERMEPHELCFPQ